MTRWIGSKASATMPWTCGFQGLESCQSHCLYGGLRGRPAERTGGRGCTVDRPPVWFDRMTSRRWRPRWRRRRRSIPGSGRHAPYRRPPAPRRPCAGANAGPIPPRGCTVGARPSTLRRVRSFRTCVKPSPNCSSFSFCPRTSLGSRTWTKCALRPSPARYSWPVTSRMRMAPGMPSRTPHLATTAVMRAPTISGCCRTRFHSGRRAITRFDRPG